jgi:hypothetical protein
LEKRIASSVSLELISRGAVVRKPIAFGDDSLFSPKKVDPVRTNLCLKFEWRHRVRETQAEHLRLKDAFGLFRIE